MPGTSPIAIFVVYLIVGLYLLNYALNFIAIPAFILSIEKWIIFVGGILVLFGGVKYLLSSRRPPARAY